MSFQSIFQAMISAALLVLFVVSPTIQMSGYYGSDEPIIPRKYHNLYYFILSILFILAVLYFLNDGNIDYVIGFGLSGILLLWLWYQKNIHYQVEKKLSYLSQEERDKIKQKELDGFNDSIINEKFTDSKLIRGAAIVWIFIWLGTWIDWRDYSYYTFLRIVAVLIALLGCEMSYSKSKPFFVIFTGVGILFNPIFVIKLSRELWQLVDFLVLVFLSFSYFKIKSIEKQHGGKLPGKKI